MTSFTYPCDTGTGVGPTIGIKLLPVENVWVPINCWTGTIDVVGIIVI
jgi:hypothetical protein